MKSYSRHSFSAIFEAYDLDEESLLNLATDITKNGQHDPIVLLNGEILDGWNRYQACLISKVPPTFRNFEKSEGDPLDFVFSKNIHRRHLKPSSMAAIYLKAQESNHSSASINFDSSEKTPIKDTAATLGVSFGTAQKIVTIAEKGSVALKEAVKAEEIPLAKAVAVAQMPKREQAAAVKEAVKIASEAPQRKPKPEPEPEIPDEDQPDIAKEFEAMAAENDRLAKLNASLTKDDTKKELAAVAGKFDAACGRVNQLLTTTSEMEKTIKYYSGILEKVRKLLGVEKNSEIVSTLKEKLGA